MTALGAARPADAFYGDDLCAIHDLEFGRLSRTAGADLLDLLGAAGLDAGTVVDLGCGSGILAAVVSTAGYDVLGVDLSPGMIQLAAAQAPGARFACAALLDAELPPCVAVTAVGEALNYAADPRAGLAAIDGLAARVHTALAPGGVFLFDVATPGRAGPDGVWHQFIDRAGWTMYTLHQENADRTILERSSAIFSRVGADHYRRSGEHHVLHLYDPDALAGLLRARGFDVAVLADYPGTPSRAVTPLGWRVILARRSAQG